MAKEYFFWITLGIPFYMFGQVVSAVMALIYLFRMKSVKLGRHSFAWSKKLIAKILPLGMSSFLAQISIVFSHGGKK